MQKIGVGLVWMMLLSLALTAGAQADDTSQPPAIAIGGPPDSSSSPVTVYGTASAGSGISSVIVDGVSATVSGSSWTASVPLTNVDARNIVTATVMSNAGNTATATRNVSYTPPSKVDVEQTSFNGSAVLFKLLCEASGGDCRGSVRQLRYAETFVEHQKRHRTSVLIAPKKRYVLSTGQGTTIRVALNSAGTSLLYSHRRLSITGLVTVTQRGGYTERVASFKLILKQP